MRLAKRIAITDDDVAVEVVKTYKAIEKLERAKIAKKGIKNHRELANKNSIAALKKTPKEYMAICQTVSQTWNNVSGKIAVAAFCYSLDRRNIAWGLEMSRPDVSSSNLDLIIWPNTAHEIYVELKWSARERMDQLVGAYKRYTGDRAYIITRGSDFTQNKVTNLATSNLKSVVLEDTRGLTGVYTLDDLISVVVAHLNTQVLTG